MTLPSAGSGIQRIAILTGGGDCSGLNGVIRSVVKTAVFDHNLAVYGIADGFAGLISRNAERLTPRRVSGILDRGGTILGSSNKENPFAAKMMIDGKEQEVDVSADCVEWVREMGWDAIIVVGGDGTLEIAQRFQKLDVNVVGVPKTIDNDVRLTDRTIGFESAITVATEAMDRLHTTAMSHHRIHVTEMMGRNAGWITLHSGVASGADVILLPENPYETDLVCDFCRWRSRHGKRFTIIAIAEGAHEQGGEKIRQRGDSEAEKLGGVGNVLARQIGERTGLPARATVLGHLQRGGSPAPGDRVLATRFGEAAVQLIMEKRFGTMPALQGDDIVTVNLEEVAGKQRLVPRDHQLIAAARAVGTCFGDELPFDVRPNMAATEG